MGNIELFDMPGFNFEIPENRQLLRSILHGARSPTSIPLDPTELRNFQPEMEPVNAIDFVLFVVDATTLHKGRLQPRGANPQRMRAFKETFDLVERAGT